MNIYPILRKINDSPKTVTDEEIIHLISYQVNQSNLDNISRTKAYAQFFQSHPEIRWAFLASMVSRNTGWNMCDLEGEWHPKLLSKHFRYQLFLTYERANWLIFQDAYPQLLVYHYMTNIKRNLFHILPKFNVSQFMVREWRNFQQNKDEERLLFALIVNEQHLIQRPVIDNPIFKKHVFKTKLFGLQDSFHYSCVLFPTKSGKLYGSSVSQFRNHKERIKLGKRLASILFAPNLLPAFLAFSNETEPTGSRWDYEQYQGKKKFRTTPFLRTTFPVIHHTISDTDSCLWEKYFRVGRNWRSAVLPDKAIDLTDWFEGKQYEMKAFISVEQAFQYRKKQKINRR
ncbi:MAG TPA: DUF2515 family protein [Bacillus sp. (in: firmicutes)]|uniref:DUF2515 family protein n=1 Tax=Bacillus litorisediminis TaxID=2922713 RepID=UPI001FADBB4A|nr:DUF2515 family protein [Bacillus litorisediminis]HWO76357.1 DUF2515 family protein [Bacillus sp. (in: firmicutes)]